MTLQFEGGEAAKGGRGGVTASVPGRCDRVTEDHESCFVFPLSRVNYTFRIY